MDSKISRLRKKPINKLTDPELLELTLHGTGRVVVDIKGRERKGTRMQRMHFERDAQKHGGGPRRDPERPKLIEHVRQLKAEGKKFSEIAAIVLKETGISRSADAYRKMNGINTAR